MKLLLIFVSLIIFLCNSNYEQVKVSAKQYSIKDVTEKDSLIYFQNKDVLFSGMIVEKDSLGRIVKELNYQNGLKHGSEFHYEYFESDLAVVVMEGNWTNGKKIGIWKSHDGEGQMTIIKKYELPLILKK